MAQIVERVAGRYEVWEEEFDRVYRWRSEYVVLECDCGERSGLTGSMSTCGCGAKYAAAIREKTVAGRLGTKTFTPGALPGIAKVPGYLIERASATELCRHLSGSSSPGFTMVV